MSGDAGGSRRRGRAWSGISNTNPNCNPQTQIRIRYHIGKLGPVEQLTQCDHPWTSFPVVASNARGYGIAAWIFNPSTDAIQARTISPAGKPGPLRTVTRKGDQADLVNVAISPGRRWWRGISYRRYPNHPTASWAGSSPRGATSGR